MNTFSMKTDYQSRRSPAAWFFLIIAAVLLSAARTNGDEEKAKALLLGVEQKLNKIESFHAEFEIDDTVQPMPMRHCEVSADYDHGKILFLLQWPQCEQKMSCLLRDGKVSLYIEGQDSVRLMDIPMAEGAHYAPFYDPRLIGLIDLPKVGSSIHNALFLHDTGQYSVEDGEESPAPQGKDAEKTYNVVFSKDSLPFGGPIRTEFTIAEPSFHVLKRTFVTTAGGDTPNLEMEIVNRYDEKISKLIPAETKVLRKQKGKVIFDHTIRLKKFSKKRFPDDHFSPKSMGLVLNVTFADYRTHLCTGYWNGEEVSEVWTEPFPKNQKLYAAAGHPDDRKQRVFMAFALTGLVILLGVWTAIKRRRKKPPVKSPLDQS
ncbi:MAG: hypothetical protein IKF77_09605 [Thermoguttaceae bacterium]|nr:hypothetical protein [Thermoguttaceae bacterium]